MPTDSNRAYKRGEIVQARFDPTEGSEQSGVRPALVLSPQTINRPSPVIILAPLTTRNTDRIFPFEALIEAGDGVPRQSKVLLIQLRGMSKSRILAYLGTIAPETLDQVDAALKLAVGLEKI